MSLPIHHKLVQGRVSAVTGGQSGTSAKAVPASSRAATDARGIRLVSAEAYASAVLWRRRRPHAPPGRCPAWVSPALADSPPTFPARNVPATFFGTVVDDPNRAQLGEQRLRGSRGRQGEQQEWAVGGLGFVLASPHRFRESNEGGE